MNFVPPFLHEAWESFASFFPHDFLYTYTVWDFVRPFVIWGQILVFCSLLLVATIGNRLKFRRKVVDGLEGIFQFAAFRLSASDAHEEEEEEEEELEEEENGVVICPESPRAGAVPGCGDFRLEVPIPYLTAGMRAVVQDCVNSSFSVAELRTWNMLSRTRRKQSLRESPSLTVFWGIGFVVRWVFLMPVRVLLLVISLSTLIILCSTVGLLPNSDFKKKINKKVVMWCFDFVAGSISVVARFHNTENRPTHGIAVANHTSPIDSMVLATDQCYDMVGQMTPGILGMFMRGLGRASSHIWFERTEAKERATVVKLLQEHAQDLTKPPILIYPEGTCVNNTAVFQFKKGAFEIDSVLYPIAIRFDLRYGDPYWYQDTFAQYLFDMMTSWAIVCDIWYLPPTRRGENESAVAFANRVKSAIAHKGGFVELGWDGWIKYSMPNPARWKEKRTLWTQRQQTEFARQLSHSEDNEHN